MSNKFWKIRRDEYRDDTDGDFGIHAPRLTDTLQKPEFIMRDETNREACRIMKIKKWK